MEPNNGTLEHISQRNESLFSLRNWYMNVVRSFGLISQNCHTNRMPFSG